MHPFSVNHIMWVFSCFFSKAFHLKCELIFILGVQLIIVTVGMKEKKTTSSFSLPPKANRAELNGSVVI